MMIVSKFSIWLARPSRSLSINSTCQHRILTTLKGIWKVELSLGVVDRRKLTFSDTSNGLGSIDGHDHSSGEKDDSFSPFEKLLPRNGEAQDCQRTHPSDEHMMGGSQDHFDHTAQGDRSSAASVRSSEGAYMEGHVRSTYCRNRFAAYSSFASVLNSESVKPHAEGMPHGLRV